MASVIPKKEYTAAIPMHKLFVEEPMMEVLFVFWVKVCSKMVKPSFGTKERTRDVQEEIALLKEKV